MFENKSNFFQKASEGEDKERAYVHIISDKIISETTSIRSRQESILVIL